MNQTCKVCGEPAAGFHFGAFTCEGCKSFFGRSYNNISSISECKNNNECVINKKNRTACKACRLRKCIFVGMSKSGSRYGRRSNWFKIHCLLQEQQQQHPPPPPSPPPGAIRCSQKAPSPHQALHHPYGNPLMHHLTKSKEEMFLLGLDDYKNAVVTPSTGSPESRHSDTSTDVNVSNPRTLPLFHGLLPAPFLPPPSLLFPPAYHQLYPSLLQPTNNNYRWFRNQNTGVETFNKRVLLDAILQSQRCRTPEMAPPLPKSPIQENPIDLSMKTLSERGSSPTHSVRSDSVVSEHDAGSEADEESDCDSERSLKRINLVRPTPLDLTTRV